MRESLCRPWLDSWEFHLRWMLIKLLTKGLQPNRVQHGLHFLCIAHNYAVEIGMRKKRRKRKTEREVYCSNHYLQLHSIILHCHIFFLLQCIVVIPNILKWIERYFILCWFHSKTWMKVEFYILLSLYLPV